jgi:hypothetical protein
VVRIRETQVFTVSADRTNSAAISALDSPGGEVFEDFQLAVGQCLLNIVAGRT